ncbi:MAG: Mut7-C RNAse domain-containing protein [bacterium]|nr:Mut7-C RNAse domain-containing protein [bacterium]
MESKKFIADAMLGRLTRWLRIIGYDTVYLKHTTDSVIVARAICENRIILTRDRHFEKMKAAKNRLIISSTRLAEQFQEVVTAFQLNTKEHIFSRCVECNTPLAHIDKSEIIDQVPVYVARTQNQFSQCPTCKRIYWAGTHLEMMQKKIHIMLSEESSLIDNG